MGLGDIVNSIPVFGHAKAAVHLLAGDAQEAGRAFSAATRTTAVMAGAAGGAIVGGPAGMVGGAMAAGTACDAVTSVANNRAEGVFDGLKDIGKDIGNGNVPVKSLLKTGLYVGADAISGATGGSIAGNLPKAVGKSLLKDATVVIAKSTTQAMVATAATGSATRVVAENIECKQTSGVSGASSISGKTSPSNNTQNSSSSNSKSNTGSNNQNKGSSAPGGGQPPQNQKNNTKTEHESDQTKLSHFELLCQLFGVTNLNDILIAGKYIFREINSGKSTDRGRKNSLKKLIQALREAGIIERVIEAVRNIFDEGLVEPNFQNFLNVTEMAAKYVHERLARRHEMQASRDPRPRENFYQRRDQNLREVVRELLSPGSAHNIVNIFRALRSRIADIWKTFQPTFSNIITAVTHYFKHKFVPGKPQILSVAEYFNLIQRLLTRVSTSTQYRELGTTRRRLVYDLYISDYGRRVRIVFQVQDSVIVISSCHILDIIVRFDDKDGNEEFDPEY